jgi:Flp pilus assembly pilin Flp
MKNLKHFIDDRAGNATEYALIVSLVSLAIAAGALVLGTGLDTFYRALSVSLP